MKVAYKFELTRNLLSQIQREMHDQLADLVEDTAEDIRNDIAIRMYAVGDPPSEPGSYPAVDTSNLVNSIEAEPDNIGGLTWIVATNTEYAEPLEYGTGKMAPRPFFVPSFERAKPTWQQRLRGLGRGWTG